MLNSGRESYLFITCKVPRTVSFKVDNKTVTFSVSHFNDLLFGSRHFMFANATISFKELVSAYPGPLMLVSILVSYSLSWSSLLSRFSYLCFCSHVTYFIIMLSFVLKKILARISYAVSRSSFQEETS